MIGGRDLRGDAKPIFMFYDWLPGGWGGRNGRDGCNVTTACFGTGLQSQPVEGQERVSPILTNEYQVLTDLPGPGKWRGGAGVRKTTTLGNADRTVISYICDRERAVVWGINGGLPSMPHGLSLRRAGGGGSGTFDGAIPGYVPKARRRLLEGLTLQAGCVVRQLITFALRPPLGRSVSGSLQSSNRQGCRGSSVLSA